MLKSCIAITFAILLTACSNPSGPSPVPDQTPVVSQPTVGATSPAPTPPVTAPPGPSFEGKILPFAGWDVKNTSGSISQMTAYYTSFDNQSLSLGSKTYTVQTGDSFRDTFNKTCVQVDLTYGAPGDAPFLFGYIDDNGNVVGQISDSIRKACTPVPPKKDPTCEELKNCPVDVCPNIEGVQTKVPEGLVLDDEGQCVEPKQECVPTWTLDKDYTRTTEQSDPWSACSNGERTRLEKVTYETNSCDTDDRRINHKYDEYKTEDCEQPGICYYKVDGDGGEVAHEAICKAQAGGLPSALGVWLNFKGGKLDNHCQYTVPGVSLSNFQLTPGQSDKACLSKPKGK